jgi:hypothetical protein
MPHPPAPTLSAEVEREGAVGRKILSPTHSPVHSSISPFAPFLYSFSYIAVNPAIGLKRRGAKGRVELKLLTEGGKEEVEGIKGIEHWKKYKASCCSWMHQTFSFPQASSAYSQFSSINLITTFTTTLFQHQQIGKGLAEEESLAQVHTLLEVRKAKKGPVTRRTVKLLHLFQRFLLHHFP